MQPLWFLHNCFFASLQERGLHGLQGIISDDHPGLRAALQARFPGVPWHRCQSHLQQNAGHFVPRVDMRAEVAADLRAVFDAPDRAEADRRLEMTVRKYEKSAPKLSAWLAANVPEGLTVFMFPPAHRRRLRTTNELFLLFLFLIFFFAIYYHTSGIDDE